MIFSQRLKELRKSKNMTQQDLANMLNISQGTITNYEREPDTIGIESLEKLAEIFDTSVDYLLGLTNIPQKPENFIEFKNTINIPILGIIKAGSPIFAQENIETYFPLAKEYVPENCFGLKVRGESMIEAGIHPEDIILVKKQEWFDNDGDIIVVIVNSDNEATVKRIYKDKDGIILQPANRNYKPINIPKNECNHVKILGKVIKIITDAK